MTYVEMETKISHTPQNEQELVEIRDFIKKSRDVTMGELAEQLKEVERHYELIEDFCYTFEGQEQAIENAMGLKCQPMKIGMVITEGNTSIASQEENFSQVLEQQKDEFYKKLRTFEEEFQVINKFKSIS